MKHCWFILALVFSLVDARAANRDIFSWRAPLVGGWTNGGLYVTAVPLSLLDHSEAFPADLRIVDENEREWPFYVAVPNFSRVDASWNVTAIEHTEQAAPVRYLRYAIQLQARHVDPVVRHNRVVLLMSGHDFERRVEVLGREPASDWQLLGQASLVNRPGESQTENRTVEYDATTVTQLQFRIYPTPQAADEPLEVIGLSVLTDTAPRPEIWLNLKLQEDDAAPNQKDIQTFLADVGYRHVPLRLLKLDLGPGEQACPVKVYGRHNPTNDWRWVADGGVHGANGQPRNTVELHQSDYRYLKIEIYHYWQDPMSVRGAQACYEPLQVVFEANGGQEPFVYFGAGRPPLPHYDLQLRVGSGVPARAQAAEIGNRGRNPAHVAATLLRYGRTLGLSALGVLAGLGLLVLVNQVRRRFA